MNTPAVLITGSTQGIGYGIAEAFARAGARLVINSHLDDGGALARLSALTECHFIRADLSSVEGARQLVQSAHEALGGLDTLVNCAGTFLDSDFLELTPEQFDRTFALNVRGYLFATQAFARLVGEGEEDASVVCIGSTNSFAAEKQSVIYDASKGAVLMLVKSMALTLAERGIRVNGIAPGIIETPLTRSGLDRPGVRDHLDSQIPLGRIGQIGDIGEAAVFLASAGARYITGQMLAIDGGILTAQKTW